MTRNKLLFGVIIALGLMLHGVQSFSLVGEQTKVYDINLNLAGSALPKLNQPSLAAVSNVIEKYKDSSNTNSSSDSMSNDAKRAQTGKLFDFYLEDKQLRLKGVIGEGSRRFAIIEAIDVASQQPSLIRLTDGQQYQGYNVSIVDAKQVTFSRQEQKVTLVIYSNESLANG
ncbi:hypothetical protein SIO17_17830 [Pseudoalteromonas piscicida]|uniref:Type II secretion system protein GspC N-terminal domain-containing protein n=1 Tax=Pseudoalteromonas piscicida TaxID=43662 RepID=A0ABM6NIZ6_PSEO7|nr:MULTISPECIES: hypothetical protein [Pseudoalteromonas]ATD08933.1 hypothetical protein PPIS_a4281 [Pseudoalteromonas piscicida]ODB36787.1 hypothetical protein BB427_01885 [Pseudoalteromonas sp. BMB]WPU30916.1 hypothetical protein SIO17_17830 [Pseudoalteromonas piscicida]